MRITSKLKAISVAAIAALVLLTPVLVWSIVEYRSAGAARADRSYQQLIVTMGAFALILVAGLVLSALHLNALIRKRLLALDFGAKKIAQGDLAYRIADHGPDEFGDLALTLNAMTAKLEAEILAHTQAQDMLRTLTIALEQSPTSVIITNLDARIEYVNPRFSEVTGYAAAQAIGKNPRIFQSGQMTADFYQHMWATLTAGKIWHGELYNRRKNGEFYWEESHIAPVRNAAGVTTHYVAVKTDITQRKFAEGKLQLAASVFTHAREGIGIADADGNFMDVNEAFSRITGYRREEVLGRNPRILKSGRQGNQFYAELWRDLLDKGYWSGEIWNRRKSGEVYAEILTISAVRNAQGRVQQYVALFSDITPLKEQQQQLERIAHFDALTNLPNRVLLSDRLHQAIAQAQRRRQHVAVVFLDLDGFKAVNDQHGHDAGDHVLMVLAARMKEALREGDTIARLGGDEFVAVLIDLEDVAAAMPMVNRLLTAAAQAVTMDALTLQVSASLGVTFYPQAQDMDADQLLRQADHAMYQAKLAGRNRFHIFDAAEDGNPGE